MKFKVGDIVVCIDNREKSEFLTEGNLYTVTSSRQYITLKETGIKEWRHDRFELALIDCKLNRALYPELVSINGFLAKVRV